MHISFCFIGKEKSRTGYCGFFMFLMRYPPFFPMYYRASCLSCCNRSDNDAKMEAIWLSLRTEVVVALTTEIFIDAVADG